MHAALLLLLGLTPARAADTGVRWVRDSVEYWALARQTYAVAGEALRSARKGRGPWTVVLDVDETVLDNSAYQLERAAYAQPFDHASWNAWCERRAAGAVPGAPEFVARVREEGGRVVFLTNRHEGTRGATIDNLAALGLWTDADLLCLATDDPEYGKAARRAELLEGNGPCSFEEPIRAALYVGDAIGDFPERGEEEGVGWSEAFGVRYFLLPNPMYGGWTRAVTRPMP